MSNNFFKDFHRLISSTLVSRAGVQASAAPVDNGWLRVFLLELYTCSVGQKKCPNQSIKIPSPLLFSAGVNLYLTLGANFDPEMSYSLVIIPWLKWVIDRDTYLTRELALVTLGPELRSDFWKFCKRKKNQLVIFVCFRNELTRS